MTAASEARAPNPGRRGHGDSDRQADEGGQRRVGAGLEQGGPGPDVREGSPSVAGVARRSHPTALSQRRETRAPPARRHDRASQAVSSRLRGGTAAVGSSAECCLRPVARISVVPTSRPESLRRVGPLFRYLLRKRALSLAPSCARPLGVEHDWRCLGRRQSSAVREPDEARITGMSACYSEVSTNTRDGTGVALRLTNQLLCH